MKTLKTIRTDVVGSLLRPKKLVEARQKRDDGKIGADEFRAIEDDAVRDAVLLQQAIGLDVITDGEFRRLNFQDSFGSAVTGFDARPMTVEDNERKVAGAAPGRRWTSPDIHKAGAVSSRRPVKERLRLKCNVALEEYESLAKLSTIPAKVSLIGPDRIIQRFDYENSKATYATVDEFAEDVIRIERDIVASLIKAGCSYIHIDAPGFTAYVDESSLEQMRTRGEDPEKNFSRAIEAESRVLKGFEGVTSGVHLCRGNQRSMWHREGSYDAIAERLFNELPHDRFMLEYDNARAGGFEPLRFVPKEKIVVLGLVSTKVSEMETVDGLQRRIEQASKYISLDQLAISPQCGFASDIIGNIVTPDEQKRKLELVVETARRVWS